MIDIAMLSIASILTSMFGGQLKFTSTTQAIVPVQGNNFGYVVASVPSTAPYSYSGSQYGEQIKSVQSTGTLNYYPSPYGYAAMPTFSGTQLVAPYPGAGFISTPYTIKYVQTATSTGYVAISK